MQEDPDRNSLGHFQRGHSISRGGGVPSHYQKKRKEIRMAFIKAIHDLLRTPEDGRPPQDDGTLSKFDYMIQHAIFTKNYKFLEYAINQAIGKPLQPVAQKIEGSTVPTTIIRKLDGSVIEYKIEDKSVTE